MKISYLVILTKCVSCVQATLGPNVVTLQPGSTTPSTTTTPATPGVHQLTPMAPVQVLQPMLGTPQNQLHPQFVHAPLSPMSPVQTQQMMAGHHSHGQSQPQNTIIVPQIVQVPQSPPPQAPQPPIIIQQQQPQMSQSQMQQIQQMQLQMQQQQQQQRPNYHSHPVFNVISAEKAAQNGVTSISHELPSGEKVEISMKLTDSKAATKTQKKPTIPSSAPRPTSPPKQSNQQTTPKPDSATAGAQIVNLKVKKPSTSVQDLVDLFGKKISSN